jgi:hypothetical protein
MPRMRPPLLARRPRPPDDGTAGRMECTVGRKSGAHSANAFGES